MKFTHFSPNKRLPGWKMFRALIACLLALIGLVVVSSHSQADENPRIIEKKIQVQVAHWQLARWQDYSVTCNMYVKHESYPTLEDARYSCGIQVMQEWASTPACYGGNTARCSGLFLRYVGQGAFTEIQEVEIPPITMEMFVTDCQPGQWCQSRPGLKLVAKEPVEGYNITNIYVRVRNDQKSYDGSEGELRLPATDENGEWLEFWAQSNLGDESQLFQVRYRAVAVLNGDQQGYRFDLLNDQWASSLPSAALLWGMFPPSNEALPVYLEQPFSSGYLGTSNRYALLAGHLIQSGLVDASSCAGGGLNLNGTATVCGEMSAGDAVLEWQNKYDQQIYQAAQVHDIPAHVLKGMIAQESQFWPKSTIPYELGLGYITERGVDMLLNWNLGYYLSICLPAYGEGICGGGYASLRADRQTLVRRAAFDHIGNSGEIDLIAAMLYASAAQTQQMVKNITRTEPVEAITYEDMWKLSIANYYAGSGCIGNALYESLNEPFPLTWPVIASHLDGVCKIADDYVKRVISYSN